ncbi:hypothetical protein JW978_03035 [Candidatus Dojkabacteria bacterium]|nr:hypothetical protein [Candidatus Dojkabacteria bacterium]
MAKNLLKKLISPMQDVLLQKNYCPACTRKLDSLTNRDPRPNGTVRVECVCGRIYIYENETKNYRRALETEV